MVDIGRISSKRWAISLLVFLCISAVLFMALWILSVFYESGPYGNWKEEARFTPEKQGNKTLLCTAGPCLACTSSEKDEPSFKCSPAGYHMTQQCTEDVGDDAKSRQALSTNKVATGDQKKSRRRLLTTAEDGLQMSVIYKTCIPQEVKEKLSVFGFEGVVLLFLLLSASGVHYRKNRGAPAPGLQRIPSNARF